MALTILFCLLFVMGLFAALRIAPSATSWLLDWLAFGTMIVGGIALVAVALLLLPLLKEIGTAIIEHFGLPNLYYRSWRNPPWKSPRLVSSSGHASRQERADYDALLERLTLLPSDPSADPADYLAPRTFRDPVTGQHWRQERFEMGLSQWETLHPIAHPSEV